MRQQVNNQEHFGRGNAPTILIAAAQNISNQEKLDIVRVACSVFGVTIPGDIEVGFPNAE